MTKKQRREFLKEKLGKDRKFDMSRFFGPTFLNPEQSILQTGKVPEEICGTACCIAGEAAIRFPRAFRESTKRLLKSGKLTLTMGGRLDVPVGTVRTADGTNIGVPIAVVAGDVLGVKPDAFFVDYWPSELERKYYDRGSDGGIDLALQAIDAFTVAPKRKTAAKSA